MNCDDDEYISAESFDFLFQELRAAHAAEESNFLATKVKNNPLILLKN